MQNKTLSLAIQEIAKLKEEKDNYYYMMNSFKLEISRIKEENFKKEASEPTQTKYHEDL